MARQRQRIKRANTASSADINSLINAANTNDRFKLLEDVTVLPGDLTNPVHAIFHQLEGVKQLQQALRLASQFLHHDQLLEFFVPLLFGRESIDAHTKRKYLCDPLLHASKAKYEKLLLDVREAFQTLAERVKVCFVQHKKERLYARTLANDAALKPTQSCCRIFQEKVSPKIEITDSFLVYYRDPTGYAKASLCSQFRHDFHFAITLVHEVVHALGVMRRGNFVEPYYRLDFPETEWGYAWENFMFGSIINPQDKPNSGTHLLMHKAWADCTSAEARGGKEYCDVPMSWVAQWFRRDTWDIVAKQGPTGVAPPTTHFKIQTSRKLGAWVVTSDCPDVRKDIADLYKRWQKYGRHLMPEGPAAGGPLVSHKVYYNTRTTAELQSSNVPIPQRLLDRKDKPTTSLVKLLSTVKTNTCTKKQLVSVDSSPNSARTTLVAVCHATSPCSTRKRRRDSNDRDDDQSVVAAKRLCTEPTVDS